MSEVGNSNWKMSLEDLVAGTEGQVLSQFARVYDGIGTDTRTNLTGKIFVALEGENFDAHDFLPQAAAAGASALLVHRLPDSARNLSERVTIVKVDDTLKAFQRLGRYWRHKMPAKVVGITGTNGKTTSKEFCAALIGSRYDVQYSKGSFNNHWGVPMSLLSISPKNEVAIIEMGMNHAGELSHLSRQVDADIVVCTMVGRGHLEGLGSIAGVAKAKSEIYEHAPEGAVRIYNLENDYTREMYERDVKIYPPSRILTFAGLGFSRSNGYVPKTQSHVTPPATQESALAWPALDVALEVVAATPESLHVRGEIRGVGGETTVPVFGQHNVTNLMVAATCALACGMTPVEVWTALPRCRTVWGRNQWVRLQNGARVLFDGYNANPESMKAALDNFAALEASGGGRKYAVLGEMKEMGEHAEAVHRELGDQVGRAGFDGVAFFGPSSLAFKAGMEMSGTEKTPFISNAYEQDLAAAMLPVLDPNDIVLIKGSRGMQLEKALLDMKPIDFQPKK